MSRWHLWILFADYPRLADDRDDETGAHMCRAGKYCEALARRLGLGEQVVEGILHAGPLHDVGKIGFLIMSCREISDQSKLGNEGKKKAIVCGGYDGSITGEIRNPPPVSGGGQKLTLFELYWGFVSLLR
jgi:hypothetical protein